MRVRSGQFEFVKLNAKEFDWRDTYHLVLNLSWPLFAGLIFSIYLLINLVFAALYMLDPHAICVDQGPTSCGQDGTCDGQGACSLYPAGMLCAASSTCSGTLWSGPGTCSGTGTCQRQTIPCTPYACDPQTNACHTACVTADDCAPGKPCMNGSCGYPEPAFCSTDAECATGFCAQGACCATKCDSPCFSCALPGTAGTCTPVPNPPDAGACAR